MAKIFLDTNYFIDALHRKPEQKIIETLEGNEVYISSLSWHIFCYVFKIKVPNEDVIKQKAAFNSIDFSEDILDRSLLGPTSDFEDNVQLHSAAEADCDMLLTADKELLQMKFFGKMSIVKTLYP